MRLTNLALLASVCLSSLCLTPVLSCAPTTYVVAPDPPPPPRAPLDPFFDELGPFGDWWWSDAHGWVWSPRVGVGWRPYTVGHWAWTSEWGWVWMSGEPFGWATFHYGRWIWLNDAGWVWIPGRVWGPAWVMWRSGPGYIGWVPLGPGPFSGAHMQAWWWVFVEQRHFMAQNVVAVVAPPHHNPAVLSSTRVLHRPERHDGRAPPNREVEVSTIERATGVKVIPKRIVEARDAGAELPDAIAIRRARAVEQDRAAAPRDLFAPSRSLARDRVVEERALPAPTAEDAERHFQTLRERALADHEAERRAPPGGIPTDQLRSRQAEELRILEEQELREKELAKKKKTKVRPTLPGKAGKSAKRAPTTKKR